MKAYSKDFFQKLKEERNTSKVIKTKAGCVCFSSKLSKEREALPDHTVLLFRYFFL